MSNRATPMIQIVTMFGARSRVIILFVDTGCKGSDYIPSYRLFIVIQCGSLFCIENN